MKVAEMNARQKKAYYNIYWAAQRLLGVAEDRMTDCPKDSEEYKSAEALLNNHKELVSRLYEMATTGDYRISYGNQVKRDKIHICDINFCGKEWLMERCEKRITKEGY